MLLYYTLARDRMRNQANGPALSVRAPTRLDASVRRLARYAAKRAKRPLPDRGIRDGHGRGAFVSLHVAVSVFLEGNNE